MNPIRIGKFTSSEIVALTTNGKKADTMGQPFYTYVKRKKQERKMGCHLSTNDNSKSLTWGKFLEWWLMFKRPDIIGLEYTLTPETTLSHPEHSGVWVGSKDGHNNNTNAVIDIKCPWTREPFADFAECTTIDEVRDNHKAGEQYYWQLVSNAAISGVNKAELIVFMPSEDQLKEIQGSAIFDDHKFMNDVYFIGSAVDGDLPFVPKTSVYPNLLRFCFDVPQADIDFLTERVKIAGELLTEKNKL